MALRLLLAVALVAGCKGTIDGTTLPADLSPVDLVPGPDACPSVAPASGGACTAEQTHCSYPGAAGTCDCVAPEDQWVCCAVLGCDPTPPMEGALCCAAQGVTRTCGWCDSDGTFTECDCAPGDRHWRCMGANCKYPGTDGPPVVDAGTIEIPDAADAGA